MSSATINSILARCIVDTAFLERLAREPSAALDGYALDPQTYSDFLKLDIGRLRNFAGVVTKVQNNGLWEHFLHTRMLLNYYRVDLELFTAYRETHLQNRLAQVSRNQQIERFLSFLEEYLAPEYPKYPALRETLAHEQLTWEARLSFSNRQRPQSVGRALDIASLKYHQFLNLVPVMPSPLHVEEFYCDPLKVISDLTEGKFNPRRLRAEPRWLGYWADSSTEQLRILQLDPPIAALLRQVNGRRSIRTLIRRVVKEAQSELRASEFRRFIKVAFDEGLLSISGDHSAKELSSAGM